MATIMITAKASDPAEFGNLEANLRFLDASGLLHPAATILEIGSGRGTLLHELQQRGFQAIGVETSEARIADARARFAGLPVHPTDGTTLPFPDETFDVVLSFDVFEHIADSDAHLREVRRVLKPTGWYLLQTPNRWSNTIFETIRWRSFTKWRADHCALHNARELERRFRRLGFSVTFADVPVVTEFYRRKVRQHLGWPGAIAVRALNPDRLPVRLRTNLYVRAQKTQ